MIEGELIALIKDFGFPVVAFLLMWYQSNTVIRRNTDAIMRLNEAVRGGK